MTATVDQPCINCTHPRAEHPAAAAADPGTWQLSPIQMARHSSALFVFVLFVRNRWGPNRRQFFSR
jgi:hypothetical protein